MTFAAETPERLLDSEFHATGDLHGLWRWMRTHAPVHWHPPGKMPGFWSVTRYEDVKAIYLNPRVFSSAYGVLLRPIVYGSDPGSGLTLALLDPPRHRQLRSIIAEWFTEANIRTLEGSVRGMVRGLLEAASEQGKCDFAHEVAGRLTLHIICALIGIPVSDIDVICRWTYEALDCGRSLVTHLKLVTYLIDMMQDRMAEPRNDVMSALVSRNVGDVFLTEHEVLLNCENLIGAAENAGLSMAGGMLTLLKYRDQWLLLKKDRLLLASSIEEMLRWTSSATHSMRTAMVNSVVRSQTVQAGDRVVLWVPSANRDENVFQYPDRFDITRSQNRHLSLGAGEHYCIGSALARAQIGALMSECLEDRYELEICGDIVPVRSIAVNGPARMPVRIRIR